MSCDEDYVAVVACDALEEGAVKRFYVPEIGPIALYHVGGEYYASDDMCTHGQSSLSEEGMLDGHLIYCGWHSGAFDIRSGDPVEPPCFHPLRTYDVKVIGGIVRISAKKGAV